MARQPLPADTILGSDTDQYRIDTVLGPGGFGITYLGRSLRLDRDVAIKEYFPAEFAFREDSHTIRSIAHGSQSFFEQGKRYFIEEARTLGKFRHEHIVRVIGLIEQNNTAYMVLEFEEGRSLKQWLRDLGRRPTQRQIDAILEPMLSALEAIHAKGIFHRDIAPDNIIVRPNGKPVLIDFGAARQLVRGTSQTLGAIVKHGYSPPEQYTVDTRLQGAWSDIYALSATFFHAIVGKAPEEASKRQLNDTLLPVESHLDTVNLQLYRESFIAGLNAGLALKPKDRPQTIGALRDIILDGAEVSAPWSERRGDERSRPSASRTGPPTNGRRTPTRSASDEDARGTVLRSPEASYQAAWRGDELPAGHETAARLVGLLLLAVGVVGAVIFLALGGGSYSSGLLALVVAVLGASGAAIERLVALQRAPASLFTAHCRTLAVSVALGLAVLWLAQIGFMPLGPLLPLLVLAAVFAFVPYGSWTPLLLGVVALLQGVVVIDAVLGNIDRAGSSLPILMTGYVVVSLVGLVGAASMWAGGQSRAAEPAI